MGKLSKGGTSVLIGGQKGSQHLRTAAGVSDEQAAMMVMAGGYANLFASDPAMFDAARASAIAAGEDQPHGMVERMAAGVMAFEGKSFKQTARAKERFTNALYKHAALGSEAYVSRQPGNAYTAGLEERYGKMSEETQAWGVHIFTDPGSPESGWSPRVVPATETLFGGGLPVNATYRAAAANPHVMKSAAWARPMAVRGVAAYGKALAKQMAPNETNSFKLDARAGYINPSMPGADVAAVTAIVQESPRADLGEQLIESNPGIVNAVKAVYATGKFRDYNAAYRAYRGSTTVASAGGLQLRWRRWWQPHARATQLQRWWRRRWRRDRTADPGLQRRQCGRRRWRRRNVYSPATRTRPFTVESDNVQLNMRAVNNAPMNFNASQLSGLASPKIQRQANIRFNAINGDTSTSHQTVETTVTGHVVSDNIQVNGDTGGTVEQTHNIDAVATGGVQSSGSGDLLGIVQKEMGARNHVMNTAQTFLVTALNSGFSEEQLASPQMRQDAFQIFSQNDSKMQTAAVVAHAMEGRPGGVNMENVQVVEAMMDAGWSPNRISAPDIDTARACLQKGVVYPTPKMVSEVRYHPNFSPGPNASLSPTVIRDVIQDFNSGSRDDIRRENGNATYVKPDRNSSTGPRS